jgi:hypothetical protein
VDFAGKVTVEAFIATDDPTLLDPEDGAEGTPEKKTPSTAANAIRHPLKVQEDVLHQQRAH